jgi:hypothetical protein
MLSAFPFAFPRRSVLKNSLPEGIYLPLTGKAILNRPENRKRLTLLKQLVNVTRGDYDTYYYQLLERVAGCMQDFPYAENKSDTYFNLSIERALIALMLRRGYMLPVGADAETCYQEQEVWTYAIFTAALLKDVWKIFIEMKINFVLLKKGVKEILEQWNPLVEPIMPIKHYTYQYNHSSINKQAELNWPLVEVLLPKNGLRWLMRYPHLFAQWQAFLKGKAQMPNSIANLIAKAESALP